MKYFLPVIFFIISFQAIDATRIERYNPTKHETIVTQLLGKKYKNPLWKFLSNKTARILIVDKKCVGFVSYSEDHDPFLTTTYSIIHELAIENNNANYGNTLISYIAQNTEGEAILAEVSSKDEPAKRLFKEMGFSPMPVLCGLKIQYEYCNPHTAEAYPPIDYQPLSTN